MFFVVVAHFVFFLMLSKNNKTSRYNTYLVFKLFSVNTSFHLVANDSILFYLHVAAYMFFFKLNSSCVCVYIPVYTIEKSNKKDLGTYPNFFLYCNCSTKLRLPVVDSSFYPD